MKLGNPNNSLLIRIWACWSSVPRRKCRCRSRRQTGPDGIQNSHGLFHAISTSHLPNFATSALTPCACYSVCVCQRRSACPACPVGRNYRTGVECLTNLSNELCVAVLSSRCIGCIRGCCGQVGRSVRHSQLFFFGES